MDFWGKVGAGQGFGCRKHFSRNLCRSEISSHTGKNCVETQLYFEQSALEVWIYEQGAMIFTNLGLFNSELAPTFPQQLEL